MNAFCARPISYSSFNCNVDFCYCVRFGDESEFEIKKSSWIFLKIDLNLVVSVYCFFYRFCFHAILSQFNKEITILSFGYFYVQFERFSQIAARRYTNSWKAIKLKQIVCLCLICVCWYFGNGKRTADDRNIYESYVPESVCEREKEKEKKRTFQLCQHEDFKTPENRTRNRDIRQSSRPKIKSLILSVSRNIEC